MSEEIKAICPECDELIYIEPDESFSEDEVLQCPYCLSNIRVGTAMLRYRNKIMSKSFPGSDSFTENPEFEYQFKNAYSGPKVRAYTCPNCGSSVNGAEGETVRCSYCNSVLHIDDGIIRVKITDEAKIRQAELQSQKYHDDMKLYKEESAKWTKNMITAIVAFLIAYPIYDAINEMFKPTNYFERVAKASFAGVFLVSFFAIFYLIAHRPVKPGEENKKQKK